MTKMKHCINCGAEIDDAAELCTNCGVNQTKPLSGGHDERNPDQKYCVDCGELINKQAEVCPECGVRQPDLRASSGSNSDQMAAGILAILLGGLGAHKFYQGRTGLGLLYLCFFWTAIPALLGLIEGILMLVADEEEYERKYANGDILGS
jgi:TM2 domain-containing membrane protein YozV/RNA polymerase subunit RPABC4/transcription elongation factor Spt4